MLQDARWILSTQSPSTLKMQRFEPAQKPTRPVVSQLLLFKKPHLGISSGRFCDLFSLLSSRFSLRSYLFSLLSPPVSLLSSLSADHLSDRTSHLPTVTFFSRCCSFRRSHF